MPLRASPKRNCSIRCGTHSITSSVLCLLPSVRAEKASRPGDAVAIDDDSSKKRVPARNFARVRHESSYDTRSCELSLADGNFASAVTGPAHLECVLPVQGEHVHLRKTQFRADRIQTHMELLDDDTAT